LGERAGWNKIERQMNTLKTILGLVILFGLFFACKKESNPDGCHASIYKYFKLDLEYRQNIPYTGKDTLNFIDTAGNTLTFIGQGIDSNYITEEKYNSGPACPPDINNYQHFSYDFSNNSNIRFKLSIYKQFQDYGLNVIAFLIKNHTFYTYQSRINNPSFKD
jgi:hypothetical protein